MAEKTDKEKLQEIKRAYQKYRMTKDAWINFSGLELDDKYAIDFDNASTELFNLLKSL